MKLSFALAALVAGAAALAAGSAFAGDHGAPGVYRVHRVLPPVSGTIRLNRGAFGSGQGFRSAGAAPSGGRLTQGQRFAVAPMHHYGPALGSQGQAFRQLAGQGGLDRDAGGRALHRPWWRGDGSGLVGLVGQDGTEGYAYGGETGWGTADSATTGGAYPLPSPAYAAEQPLRVAYGEPDLWSGYGNGAVAPTGGLGYYHSGSPGRLAYYGSSSSAGPGGSPGGLGIYSSGSYGPGPRIIHFGQRQHGYRYGGGYGAQGCTCGPHIIHVSRHHRTYANG